jgi:hypothetical protein
MTTVRDLVASGLLAPDERLTLRHRDRSHEATLLEDGSVRLTDDGSVARSLSTAAKQLTGTSTNGWTAWHVPRLGGISMSEVRQRARSQTPSS